MNCEICHRSHHSQKLPFLCAVDARNRLYEGRIAHATALIENEYLQQKINSALTNPNPPSSDDAAGKTVQLERVKSGEAHAMDRTSQIIAQADRLRAEVAAARKDIEERKRKNAAMKADIAVASNGINPRRSRQVEETERAIQMTRYKWNRSFENMAATRSFLCKEAARLYGLRRTKKSNSVKFELGGIEMIELPGMITASPEAISTSLAHIAHILMLASHYLAIRLPAEITLPHRDYPKPTIFSLASSYRHGEIPFPGTVVLPPPEPRDQNPKHVPRPRPLYIDRPLLTLAKEDPSTYSLFIEGVVLLAYNIAWACCTQGVPIGDKSSYEDVCNMGRNLYNLLIGNQLTNNPASRFVPPPPLPDGADIPGSPETTRDQLGGDPKPMMGRYSHGTAHTFLGSAEGNEFTRGFKLPNPVKLADRLKKKMLSDADGLDWEMLNDDAWAVDEPMEDGVQAKGKRLGETDPRLFGVESVMSNATARTTLDSTIADFTQLDDGTSSSASFEDVGRKSEDLSFHKELVIRDPRFRAKGNTTSDIVPDVKFVLQYKGFHGSVVESRESDKPFDVAADSNDDEESSLKPVIEIITTVSETGNSRNDPMPYRSPPPPVYYDSQSEFDYDDGHVNANIQKVEKTEMIVHSKHLINAFNAVIGSYPGTNFLGETVSIEAPYYALIYHRDGLSRYRIAQPALHDDEYAITTAKHIDVLLSFLDKTYGEKIHEEEARHKRTPPVATSDWLWLLLKPGEVIYKKLQNTWAPFIISHVDSEHDRDGKLLRYHVDCWDIRFLHGRMKRCMNVFTIPAFSGEQAISTLEVVPAAFFPENLQKQDGLLMADKQIAIGKTYWELVKRPTYKEYDGKSVDVVSMRRGHVTGRVIVDAVGYERFCKPSPAIMNARRYSRRRTERPCKPREPLPQFSPRCSCKVCSKVDRTSEAPGPLANFDDLNPLEDASPKNDLYFLVCTPNIPAFILADRKWGHVSIDKLSEVKCDTEAFKYLVLNDDVKLTVKALIGKFASNDGKVSPWPNDFVRNKGEGRIFLLHGSPGVGKTCTAECIAELTRRPLLSLTSGDVSTSMSSDSVERNLNHFLTLGERYGALVLLDEADVYLEERRTRDLRRNGLVSIFLRALEYYRGVLFLTTNRVESFDPAFTSRIHVALHYKRLSDQDRARIWANNFDRLERDSQGKVYVTHGARDYACDGEGDNDVNKLRWNGREIRNALQTAVALAETEAEEEGLERVGVAAKHLKQVVKMSRGFKDFMRKRRGYDADEDDSEDDEGESEDDEVASEDDIRGCASDV
ncbi:hypothetical protein VMCG_03584 [Cytospora schulzeri]|uniref:Autophagy-related protein 14 n=1 Tax=Cytospora schulzeri TaxID=448051 RepID=A0A423WWD1_9PEZI|nr:hypothetical protein VMCG_03584 [Valsa malicola]